MEISNNDELFKENSNSTFNLDKVQFDLIKENKIIKQKTLQNRLFILLDEGILFIINLLTIDDIQSKPPYKTPNRFVFLSQKSNWAMFSSLTFLYLNMV